MSKKNRKKRERQNKKASAYSTSHYHKLPLALVALIVCLFAYLVFVYIVLTKSLGSAIPSLEVAYYSFKYACQNLLSNLSSVQLLLYLPGIVLVVPFLLRFLSAPARIVFDLLKTFWLIKGLRVVDLIDENVLVFKSDHPYAFTAGVVSKKTYLSQWVVENLTKHELEAVLIHESSHLESHDNLKLLLARFLHYILPGRKITATLIDSMSAEIEQRCDDAVVAKQKKYKYLRSAWRKFAQHGALQNGLVLLSNFSARDGNIRRGNQNTLSRSTVLVELLKLCAVSLFFSF